MNEAGRGYLFVISAFFFLGTQGSIGKFFMNSGIHPVALAASRIILAAFIFLLHILLTDPSSIRVQRRHWPFFLFFGISSVALLHICLNYAIYWSGVATAIMLLYTAPSWVTLLSIFFFKEKPSKGRILSLVLTLSGAVLIMRSPNGEDFNRWGTFFGLTAGFCYSLWSILGKKALTDYSVQVVNFWNLFVGGLVLLGASFFLVPSGEVGLTAPAILGIAFMAFLNTWLPYNFYVAGMKYISAAKASILSNFELVIAVLLGRFLFGEMFTSWKIGGFIAIGAGLILIAFEDLWNRG